MDSPEAPKAPDIATTESRNLTAQWKVRGRKYAPWIILASVTFGLYFNSMGSFHFTDPGESYYTEAAREMVESKEWIVPHLNYQIYFSKPILTFWLIAASYKAFGISEWAARLPFALAALMMVFATYSAGKKLFNQRAAFLAALITACVPLNVVFCKTSPIDLLFCAFLNVAVLGFAMAVFTGSTPWALALWAALGLSVLTKGPAGLVFFAIGTALFLVMEKPSLKTLWAWFLKTKPLIGISIFAFLVLPWYVAVWKATKGLYLQVFFIYENFGRLAGKTNLHKSSLSFFLPVLAYGFAPWFLILPQTIKMALGEPFVQRWLGAGRLNFKSTYRPHLKDAAINSRGETAKEAKPLAPVEIERLTMYYLSTWSLAIFLFFSLSKTQLDTYIEPILTPLALITAATIVKLVESQKSDDQKIRDKFKYDARWIKAFAYIAAAFSGIAALACLGGAAMPYMPFHLHQRLLLLAAAIAAAVGCTYQFKLLKKAATVEALIAQALTLTAITSGIMPVAFQLSGDRRQDNMVALARTLKGSKEEIALFGTYMPSAMYYMERPVDFLSSVDQFSVTTTPLSEDGFCYGPTPSGRKQYILGDDKHMAKFATRPDLKLQKIASQHDWSLYELTNGYAERPRRLEETFRYLLFSHHSFMDTGAYGPLTVPLGSGDADWFKYRR